MESSPYILANLFNLTHAGDRIYTQVSGEKARQLARKREARRNASAVGATRIDDHGITAEETLELVNKVFAPYTVEFASSMSWFAVWKGKHFSSPELLDRLLQLMTSQLANELPVSSPHPTLEFI